MPRARVPTRILSCLIAVSVAAGAAAAEKPAARNPGATTQQAPSELRRSGSPLMPILAS